MEKVSLRAQLPQTRSSLVAGVSPTCMLRGNHAPPWAHPLPVDKPEMDAQALLLCNPIGNSVYTAAFCTPTVQAVSRCGAKGLNTPDQHPP